MKGINHNKNIYALGILRNLYLISVVQQQPRRHRKKSLERKI